MKRQHYIQYEIFYILLITFSILALNTWINVKSTIADYQRLGLTLEYWKPLVWEISSQLLTILLIPCIILIERYFPLNKQLFLKNITFHGLFTIPFSLLHVIGMVLLRKLYYLSIGDEYDLGAALF